VSLPSHRSWISRFSSRCQQSLQFHSNWNSNVNSHRNDDDDDTSELTDRSEESGNVFVSTPTYGNGIEIIDTRLPLNTLLNNQTHPLSTQQQQQQQQPQQGVTRSSQRNSSSGQLTVRGINVFVEESKSLRDYSRVKGKPRQAPSQSVLNHDHEKDQGLRQRKSTNIS
jgi:hypothetical protein